MRLTDRERIAIVECARDAFGDTCEVRLFGSWVDDRRRGGDIDLHIVAEDAVATLANEIAFTLALQARTDEQRVDVVLQGRSRSARPIDEIALRTGLRIR